MIYPDPEGRAVVEVDGERRCGFCGAVAERVTKAPHDTVTGRVYDKVISTIMTVEPCGHARIDQVDD